MACTTIQIIHPIVQLDGFVPVVDVRSSVKPIVSCCFGIDYVYANELEIIDGKLTGRYLGDVVDGKRKAELLRLIAQVEKVDIAQTIAVGDGANDLPMLGIAGLGIAFHAKPKVVANAKQSINTIGLDGVLYFLGFKDSYLNM